MNNIIVNILKIKSLEYTKKYGIRGLANG